MKNVLENGVFFAANQLYGLTFKERTDLPKYRDDIWTYDVFDADGKQLAIFIFDPYARESSAAALDELLRRPVRAARHPAGGRQPPQHPQAAGRPADPDDLGRGHHHVPRVRPCPARHVLQRGLPVLQRHQRAARLRRVPVPGQRDVGRLAVDPTNYAKHHQTGEPMPQALLDKVLAASKFNGASPPPSTWARPCSTSAGTRSDRTRCRRPPA